MLWSRDTRAITAEEIDTFWRNGVVCLRGIIPLEWVELVRESMEEMLRSPQRFDLTEYGAAVGKANGRTPNPPAGHGAGGSEPGHFYSSIDTWLEYEGFRRYACESPLPGIVGALLKSRKINLYEDSALVKEPGTVEKTFFHQDLPYFHVDGEQVCTSWLPVDPVTQTNGGLQFIKGSHRWKAQYRPNYFVNEIPMEGTDGEPVPDFHADRRNREIIFFDMQPGDLSVHHGRTIHGAAANSSLSMRRRALSVRYCGDDARYKIKRNMPQKPHHKTVVEGTVVDHERCPVVWRSDEADADA